MSDKMKKFIRDIVAHDAHSSTKAIIVPMKRKELY